MCSRCHGVDGRGDPEIQKTLPTVRDFHDPEFQARATNDSIARTIMAGKGQMPAFGTALSRAQDSGALRLRAAARPSPGGRCEDRRGDRAGGDAAVGCAVRRRAGRRSPRPSTRSPRGATTCAKANAVWPAMTVARRRSTSTRWLTRSSAIRWCSSTGRSATGASARMRRRSRDYRAFLEAVPAAPNRAEIEAKIATLTAPLPAPPDVKPSPVAGPAPARPHGRRPERPTAPPPAHAPLRYLSAERPPLIDDSPLPGSRPRRRPR